MEELVHVVELFSDDSDEEIEDNFNFVPRKPYTIRPRTDHLQFWDDEEFLCRLRISKRASELLLEQIVDIIRFPTERNHALTPAQQLLIILRYFACGSFLKTMGEFAGVHETTVSTVVRRVSEALCSIKDRFICLPEGDEITETQQSFYNIAAFPPVLLAIDGTHVRIQSPGGPLAEQFRNRKGFVSLNVQIACDSKLKIRNIVARWPGSTSDSLIFVNSRIKAIFDNGMGNCLLVGDSGYACSKYLMTPVLEPRTRGEQMYNESQIRTRNPVERTIGVWKRRFPVLSLGMRVRVETVQDIVATAVVHNIALSLNEEVPPIDEELQRHINEIVPVQNEIGGDAFRRELINHYFTNICSIY